MNRKDLEFISRHIKVLGLPDRALTREERAHLANHFALALDAHTSGFDRERFLKACGVAP